MLCAFCVRAQTHLTDSLRTEVEVQTTLNNGYTPLWQASNRHGLSSVHGSNALLRAGVFRDASADADRNWRVGYGVDLAAMVNYGTQLYVQQAYADLDYRWFRLSIGSKERPMEQKNQELSSGSQTFGINARPIPQIRIEIPEYIDFANRWLGVKGHFGYGFLTDGHFQKTYVNADEHYVRNALYHSQALYVRIGRADRFPLVFEGGLEWGCQFGGTAYRVQGYDYFEKVKMPSNFKAFVHAIYGGGSDETDDGTPNAAGNTLGSWLFSLRYEGDGWNVRAYYDHFFEDHSQVFGEYGWRDGLIGIEANLPRNPFVSTIVYENLRTDYQSGAVYHDANATIPDQISSIDNYYNHIIYQGWQHFGQAIGNPLYVSPLYRHDGTLVFAANRFRANHFALCGDPAPQWHWRLLLSHIRSWGTYSVPFSDVKKTVSALAEVSYRPFRLFGHDGWRTSASIGFDSGSLIHHNFGLQLSLGKTFHLK